MKKTIVMTAIVAAACIGAAGCGTMTSEGSPGRLSEPCYAKGDATIMVRHVVTKAPLGGMPVQLALLTKVGPQDEPIPAPDSNRKILVTSKDGMVRFRDLKEGSYRVWVFYNQISSEVQAFAISETTPSVSLTIYFNPDIDAK
jgi:hypothetical protein